MTKATICGIMYRITQPEPWTAIFTEDQPIGGRPTRFMLSRHKDSLWQFEQVDGWGFTPCHHIASAYEWCKANIGGDHDLNPLPPQTIVRHKWAFDEHRRTTYCRACGQDMSDGNIHRSCQPGNASDTEILRVALSFYADPDTYEQVDILGICGLSTDKDALGEYGARARVALGERWRDGASK